MMYEGVLATLGVILLTFLFGAFAGVWILRWLWCKKSRAEKSFPFLDELIRASSKINHELDVESSDQELDLGRAIRQGLFMIALAIVSGLAISGLLQMIGNLATPAG